MTNISNEKGIALVIVLWIAVVLSSITAAAAYLCRLELRQAYYPAKEMQLIGAAILGLEKVKAVLVKDDSAYDSFNSAWRTAFQNDLSIGDISLHIDIMDEESKANLNVSPRASLENIAAFNNAPNKTEMIESFIDWIDSDSIALPSGAENDYYLSLNPPSQCKNSSLDCMDELSLIKGFNDPKIIESLKYSSTATSNGKININTAPVEALMTLPQIDYTIAQVIIAYRNGKDLLPGTADDLPFDNISKLQAVVGSNAYNAVQNMITVKSSYFKVTLRTNTGKYSKIVEALLYRKGKNIQTKYWREL